MSFRSYLAHLPHLLSPPVLPLLLLASLPLLPCYHCFYYFAFQNKILLSLSSKSSLFSLDSTPHNKQQQPQLVSDQQLLPSWPMVLVCCCYYYDYFSCSLLSMPLLPALGMRNWRAFGGNMDGNMDHQAIIHGSHAMVHKVNACHSRRRGGGSSITADDHFHQSWQLQLHDTDGGWLAVQLQLPLRLQLWQWLLGDDDNRGNFSLRPTMEGRRLFILSPANGCNYEWHI